MKQINFFKKPGAIFILLAFATHGVQPPPAYSSQTDTSPNRVLTIPSELGKIEESFQGFPGKTMIYIQDAHDSLEAQENIAKIIGYLVKHSGVKTVFEEGYEGPVPTDEYFGFIQNPEIKEKVSYFLLDKLRLGAAEYAHINRKEEFKLIGADSIKLHLENIEWYRKNARHKKETDRDLAALQKEIDKLANQYFPKELKEWMKLKKRFDRKELSLLDYLKRLHRLVIARRAKGPTKQSKSSEIASASFGTLPRNDYFNISLLLSARDSKDKTALEKTKTIDAKILFQEMDRLEDDFSGSFLANERDRKIFHYHKSLALLARLNNIELSPPEYEAVKTLLGTFNTRDLAQFLVRQTKRSAVLSKQWEENIRNSIRFYETSRERERTLEKPFQEFIQGQEKIAVLVFGGFHKDRIKEILKEKNLSSLIVSPKITEIDSKHRDYYKRLMSIGHHSFEVPLYVRRAARPESRFLQVKAGGMKIDAAFRSELRALNKSLRRNPGLDRMELFQLEQELSKTVRAEVRKIEIQGPDGSIDWEDMGWQVSNAIEAYIDRIAHEPITDDLLEHYLATVDDSDEISENFKIGSLLLWILDTPEKLIERTGEDQSQAIDLSSQVFMAEELLRLDENFDKTDELDIYWYFLIRTLIAIQRTGNVDLMADPSTLHFYLLSSLVQRINIFGPPMLLQNRLRSLKEKQKSLALLIDHLLLPDTMKAMETLNLNPEVTGDSFLNTFGTAFRKWVDQQTAKGNVTPWEQAHPEELVDKFLENDLEELSETDTRSEKAPWELLGFSDELFVEHTEAGIESETLRAYVEKSKPLIPHAKAGNADAQKEWFGLQLSLAITTHAGLRNRYINNPGTVSLAHMGTPSHHDTIGQLLNIFILRSVQNPEHLKTYGLTDLFTVADHLAFFFQYALRTHWYHSSRRFKSILGFYSNITTLVYQLLKLNALNNENSEIYSLLETLLTLLALQYVEWRLVSNIPADFFNLSYVIASIRHRQSSQEPYIPRRQFPSQDSAETEWLKIKEAIRESSTNSLWTQMEQSLHKGDLKEVRDFLKSLDPASPEEVSYGKIRNFFHLLRYEVGRGQVTIETQRELLAELDSLGEVDFSDPKINNDFSEVKKQLTENTRAEVRTGMEVLDPSVRLDTKVLTIDWQGTLETGYSELSNGLRTGAAEFLKQATEKRMEIFIVTDAKEAEILAKLKKYGIEKYIAGVLDGSRGSKFGRLKQIVSERNLSVRQLVMIGDQTSDLEAARDAGASGIGMVRGDIPKNDLFYDEMREAGDQSGAIAITTAFDATLLDYLKGIIPPAAVSDIPAAQPEIKLLSRKEALRGLRDIAEELSKTKEERNDDLLGNGILTYLKLLDPGIRVTLNFERMIGRVQAAESYDGFQIKDRDGKRALFYKSGVRVLSEKLAMVLSLPEILTENVWWTTEGKYVSVSRSGADAVNVHISIPNFEEPFDWKVQLKLDDEKALLMTLVISNALMTASYRERLRPHLGPVKILPSNQSGLSVEDREEIRHKMLESDTGHGAANDYIAEQYRRDPRILDYFLRDIDPRDTGDFPQRTIAGLRKLLPQEPWRVEVTLLNETVPRIQGNDLYRINLARRIINSFEPGENIPEIFQAVKSLLDRESQVWKADEPEFAALLDQIKEKGLMPPQPFDTARRAEVRAAMGWQNIRLTKLGEKNISAYGVNSLFISSIWKMVHDGLDLELPLKESTFSLADKFAFIDRSWKIELASRTGQKVVDVHIYLNTNIGSELAASATVSGSEIAQLISQFKTDLALVSVFELALRSIYKDRSPAKDFFKEILFYDLGQDRKGRLPYDVGFGGQAIKIDRDFMLLIIRNRKDLETAAKEIYSNSLSASGVMPSEDFSALIEKWRKEKGPVAEDQGLLDSFIQTYRNDIATQAAAGEQAAQARMRAFQEQKRKPFEEDNFDINDFNLPEWAKDFEPLTNLEAKIIYAIATDDFGVYFENPKKDSLYQDHVDHFFGVFNARQRDVWNIEALFENYFLDGVRIAWNKLPEMERTRQRDQLIAWRKAFYSLSNKLLYAAGRAPLVKLDQLVSNASGHRYIYRVPVKDLSLIYFDEKAFTENMGLIALFKENRLWLLDHKGNPQDWSPPLREGETISISGFGPQHQILSDATVTRRGNKLDFEIPESSALGSIFVSRIVKPRRAEVRTESIEELISNPWLNYFYSTTWHHKLKDATISAFKMDHPSKEKTLKRVLSFSEEAMNQKLDEMMDDPANPQRFQFYINGFPRKLTYKEMFLLDGGHRLYDVLGHRVMGATLDNVKASLQEVGENKTEQILEKIYLVYRKVAIESKRQDRALIEDNDVDFLIDYMRVTDKSKEVKRLEIEHFLSLGQLLLPIDTPQKQISVKNLLLLIEKLKTSEKWEKLVHFMTSPDYENQLISSQLNPSAIIRELKEALARAEVRAKEQSQFSTGAIRSEVRSPGEENLGEAALDSDLWIKLSDLVAVLATGQTDLQQAVFQAITAGNKLGPMIGKVEAPRDYWSGVIDDSIKAQFPDPDRPIVELVTNAVDAVNRGDFPKEARVTLRKGDVSVEDQGSGMDLNDVLRKLLIPTISGSMGRENLIGRFGVGFYSALSYLKNPFDSLVFETSDGKTAHRVHFRVSPAFEMQIKLEPLPARPRGTKVIVQSETLLPERAEAWIREVLQFHSSKRAKIIVNGKVINAAENLTIIGSRQGVSVWTSRERAEGQGRAVVTVNGVTIFSMPVQGTQVPKITVLDFPQTTPLPVTRNTIDVTPATIESTKTGIDLISGMTPIQESLLLSALYPIVEAIQQRNPSRLPEDDVLQYLKNRVRERLNPSMKYLPDDQAGQAVKEGYYGYLHPALLDEQVFRGWKKDKLAGIETDKPVLVTDFGSQYTDRVAVVSKKVAFWNRKFVPRSPLQLDLARLYLNLNHIHVSIKRKSETKAKPRQVTPTQATIYETKKSPKLSRTKIELEVRLKAVLDKSNFPQIIKSEPGSDAQLRGYLDEMVANDKDISSFLTEVPEKVVKDTLTMLESSADSTTAGNFLNTLLTMHREVANRASILEKIEKAFPSKNNLDFLVISRAFQIILRIRRELKWNFSEVFPWTNVMIMVNALVFTVSSYGKPLLGWLDREFERLLDQDDGIPKGPNHWYQWTMFILFDFMAGSEKETVLTPDFWSYFRNQWETIGRTSEEQFHETANAFEGKGRISFTYLFHGHLTAIIEKMRSRNLSARQFSDFMRVAGVFLEIAPQDLDEGSLGARYEAMWFDETNGFLVQPPEIYERIINKLLKIERTDEGLRIDREVRPYVNFLLGAGKQAVAQEIPTASPQAYDAKINLSKLVGIFLQGERLKGSAAQLLTRLERASEVSLPSETQELAQRTIQHAANFQSTVPHVFLRELIQNAADEAVATEANPTDRVVAVNIAEANLGRLMLDFQDRFGMDLEKILNFLLIPGASTKKGDIAQIGEFGQGFFTIFKEAETVYIKTKIPRGQTVYLKLTPIRNGQDQITDVQVEIAIRKEKGPKGTTIQWVKKSRNVEMEAAFLKAFATTYAGLVSPDLLTVRWGETTLNESKRLLAEKESPHGTLRLYAAPGENTVTHRGLYVKEFDENEFWSGVPEVARKVLLKHGIVLELPAQIRLIKDRTDLANKPAVLAALRPLLTSMALDGVIKLFATGEIALDLIPYDYLTDFARYKIPDDIQTDAAAVIQGQTINVSSYSDQTRLAQLLVSMPIFAVRGNGQKLSFREILEGLRSGELQREDLPEAVSKHLIGQWQVHAFGEAIIKAERQKAKKPMKMEDRRLQDPPIEEAQALWAFRDLSEGISRLLTQIDGKPRQIVQTFYQHTGGDLAHAVQGGKAIGWNLSWWGEKLPQFGDILQGKELLDSPAAQEWFVNYLETLSHEMVHITEGSDDWTHHADFSAKQRRLVEDLIRLSSKVEEIWQGVGQKYSDGMLPEEALDVYVLNHSKFVEIEKSPSTQTLSAGRRAEIRQTAKKPNLSAIISKSKDIPASLFFAYEEVKEKTSSLREGLLALSHLTQGSKLKLVIYHADRTDLGLGEFRDLGVEVTQEGLEKAFGTFGEKSNGRNVNASMKAELLKEQLASLSGLKLKHLLVQDESEIWAAYLRAISDPDQVIPGLDDSEGYYQVVGEFLRSELRRFQASLVIAVAA